MRILSAAIKAEIAKKLGTEPINILEVQWVTDGPFLLYADKDISNSIKGKILDVGILESVIKLDFQGQSQSISVVLSDTENDLKEIFNTINVHGKICKIFQWFEGLPLDQRFKLYEGKISSPIEWSEGERTLSFEVITQLEDKEVGFSPEEGYFPFLPSDKIGIAWPFVFGNVQNVPAVRISIIPKTTLSTSLGVVDPTLSPRLGDLRISRADLIELLRFYVISLGVAEFQADFAEFADTAASWKSIANQLQSAVDQLSAQLVTINLDISDTTSILNSQLADQSKTIEVVSSGGFLLGDTKITLQSKNVILTGSFSGNTFNISDLNLSDFTGFDGKTSIGFTFVKVGTLITIANDAPIVYIINILPSTVQFVQAFKETDSGRVLTEVDKSLYTVSQEDIGPYVITYVVLSKPLSSVDPTFEDEIFVTQTSSIGPNTVDILEFLITTYTDLSFDSTSFSSVKSDIDNYPSHFALLDRRNIFSLLEDIAFQARCAIWISDGIFFLKYLPKRESGTSIFKEEDIDSGSLVVFTSPTEELVTNLIAIWRDDLSKDNNNKIILRHNVSIYGTKEREIDFFIYNISELVLKSATFWLIRFSNIWKHISFTTYLHKLEVETFDSIRLQFANNFVSEGNIRGTVTSLVFNSNLQTINIEIWMPVKIGTMVEYDFAQPSNISITTFFPTNDEIVEGIAGGDGIGSTAESTLLTPQRALNTLGYVSQQSLIDDGERIQRTDYGTEKITDIGDIKPIPDFEKHSDTPADNEHLIYSYDDIDTDITFTEPSKDFSFSFPGKILEKLSDISYNVNVYLTGLSNDPSVKKVTLLELVPGEEIEIGEWVLVAFNRWEEEDSEVGEITIKSEYTMDVNPTIDQSFSFPGQVVSKIGGNDYTVNVYTKGLSGSFNSKTVRQLQLAGGEEIPNGAWVLVAFNKFQEIDGEGVISIKSEYTMQVPIWL